MRRGFTRNLKLFIVYANYGPLILFLYIVAWLDRKIKFSLPFPRDTDDLAEKQEWCINILKENGVLPRDADVREYNVAPLLQEYIFRSNAGIVVIDYLHNGESRSLKCFAKFAPTMGTVWNRTIFNLQLNHIKEATFNADFVTVDKEVAAPKVFYSKSSPLTGNICLITEYMSESVELHDDGNASFPPNYLDLVLENMAALHARYWYDTSKRMNKIIPILDPIVDLFDSLVAFSWSVPARKILVKSWCLMNKQETVLHGDARTGNMMFPAADGKGRFVFIDWQAVRKGKGVFDLSYFLVLSLIPGERITNEQKAVETYHKYLVAKGVKDYSLAQAEEDYRHACLCLLVLLSLPMLSGEASVEGVAALIFAYGMNIWLGRLQLKFNEFDYNWIAKNYDLTEQEARGAVTEMLGVIEKRLAQINEKNAQAES